MTTEPTGGAADEAAPDPAEIHTLDDVASYLRRLRAFAGHVSYPELVRRLNTRRGPHKQARQTTVYDCFRYGRKRLDVELVLDIAAALGLDELRRFRLQQALTAARETVEAGAGVRVPRQLPAPPQMFTGRSGELAKVDRPPATPTVVITAIDGMAGVGKTALAVHAAHQIADRYPDGQLFVDLHGYTVGMAPVEPGQALDRMLRTLGVAGEQIPADLDERIGLYRSRLADRRLLIVLDNAATEAQVAPLLPGAAGCLVLVTSRRRLAGLDPTRTISLDVLPLPDAVALFTRIVGELGHLDQSPDAVAEAVELCGRLPLAIRIAAAWLGSHAASNVADLVERLRDQDQLLVTLADGSRSVAAALELSYRQLSSDLRHVYRLLGPHPGPDVDPYAAAALADATVTEARRLLDELLYAHLLQEPAAGRYVFHDLVRAHAASAAACEEAEPARREALCRLLDHYRHAASVAMDTAYPYEPERRPKVPSAGTPAPDLTDPSRAVGWLDTELPNLLAAARLAAEAGWPEHARHLSVILHRHLRTRGRYRQAETLHREGLAIARAAGHRPGELAALLGLGDLHWLQGRHKLAADHYQQALDVARATGHRPGEPEALIGLGELRREQGRHESAASYLQLALETARATRNRAGELDALLGLGHVQKSLGRYDQALARYRQALKIARSTGHRAGELTTLRGLGDVQLLQGRHELALDQYRQMLDLARGTGHPAGEMSALLGLGEVHRLQGRHQLALDRFGQALETSRGGHPAGEQAALVSLGRIHRLLGHHEPALDAYQRALDLARAVGGLNARFEAVQGLGRLHCAAGALQQALAHHRQALDLATELRQPADQARAHDGIAHAHHALGQPTQARQHWQPALNLLTSLGTDHTEDEEANVPTIRTQLANLDQQREPHARRDVR